MIFDETTSAGLWLDYPHHEIHAGSAFVATLTDISMANAETIILAWKTGADPKHAHMVFAFSSKVAGNLQLWEGPTWTAETGADCPIISRRRQTSMASSMLLADAAQAGFVAGDVMHGNPTGLNTGSATSLFQVFAQAPQSTKSASESRDTNEFMLKADTQYAVVYTATGAANGGSITLNWYEHTDRGS